MSRHRYVVEFDYPDALYEEERRIHARGAAPMPDHPCDFAFSDLAWMADRPEAKVEIVDYTQIGAPS